MEIENRDSANVSQEEEWKANRELVSNLFALESGEKLSSDIGSLTDKQLFTAIESTEIMLSRLHVERNIRQKRDNYQEK